jgi:uncharacterized protein YfaT (DUF1175 family)
VTVPPRLLLVCLVALLVAGTDAPQAQRRLRTESDRAALRAWFVRLADAQFYRSTPDVTDCAALVRHALREGLRPHTADWLGRMRLPIALVAPAVTERPRAADDSLPLFVVARSPARLAEFADARTIVELNAAPVGRAPGGIRPGDLLYFHQPRQASPDHLMIFIGGSALSTGAHDWIVYHTGPDEAGAGEMRKVRLADLLRHPAPRWRPVPDNAAFIGIFRLHLLS